MAEQRIAEAKERAVQPPPLFRAGPNPVDGTALFVRRRGVEAGEAGASAKAPTVPGRWNQVPQQRPMFTADRYTSGSPPDSRLGALPAGQRPAIRPRGCRIRRLPPCPRSRGECRRRAPRRRRVPCRRPANRAGRVREPVLGSGENRRRRPSIPIGATARRLATMGGMISMRTKAPTAVSVAERCLPQPGRDPDDYRGAHARELSNVEDQGTIFSRTSTGASPRRAEARDYNQAYREYEVTYPEESRRRTGPFLLLLALLAVAAIAGGTIYLYQKDPAGASLAKGEAPVPVVAGDGQPVKAEPEAAAETGEPARERATRRAAGILRAKRSQTSAQTKADLRSHSGRNHARRAGTAGAGRGAACQAALRGCQFRSVAGNSNRRRIRPGA